MDIADLKEAISVEVDHHTKDSPSRINADNDDRNAIRDKQETCVDPLAVSQCQNSIIIVTGKFSNKNVNVPIGEAQLQEFESACLTGSRGIKRDHEGSRGITRDHEGSRGIKRDQEGSRGIKRDQEGSRGIKRDQEVSRVRLLPRRKPRRSEEWIQWNTVT